MSKEIVKMKQGMTYSCKEKTIILNVFKYFRKINSDKSVTEIVRRTAEATGCSEKSIFQFRKEEASPEGFKEPCKTKIRKNININSRFLKYDDSVRESIKCIIYNLRYKNIVPSLSTILKNVNSSEKLPNFSLMTLRRLLFDMGFIYEKEKTSNKSILVEKTNNKDNIEQNKNQAAKNCTIPAKTNNLTESLAKTNSQHIMPVHVAEGTSQNQIYLSNQSYRPIPVNLPHNNRMIEPVPVNFQHNMIINHRMPHSVHSHNMGFIHHTYQAHNSVMQ